MLIYLKQDKTVFFIFILSIKVSKSVVHFKWMLLVGWIVGWKYVEHDHYLKICCQIFANFIKFLYVLKIKLQVLIFIFVAAFVVTWQHEQSQWLKYNTQIMDWSLQYNCILIQSLFIFLSPCNVYINRNTEFDFLLYYNLL